MILLLEVILPLLLKIASSTTMAAANDATSILSLKVLCTFFTSRSSLQKIWWIGGWLLLSLTTQKLVKLQPVKAAFVAACFFEES